MRGAASDGLSTLIVEADVPGGQASQTSLIENFFGKLKEFKRIALRADKTDQSFAAMIYLAAAIINSR